MNDLYNKHSLNVLAHGRLLPVGLGRPSMFAMSVAVSLAVTDTVRVGTLVKKGFLYSTSSSLGLALSTGVGFRASTTTIVGLLVKNQLCVKEVLPGHVWATYQHD